MIIDIGYLAEIEKEHGAVFYIVNPSRMRSNYEAFYDAFSRRYQNVKLAYAFKTCSITEVISQAHDLGALAEISSEHEYDIAHRAGFEGGAIIYNGPYKNIDLALKIALEGGYVNLESFYEVECFCNAVNSSNVSKDNFLSVGIRCNFDVDERQSRFGIEIDSDEFDKAIELLQQNSVSVGGVMCHIRARDIDAWKVKAETFTSYIRRMVERYSLQKIRYIDFGGGYRFDPDLYDQYAELIINNMKNTGLESAELILEPGAVISECAMDLYAKVVNSNLIKGKYYATIAATINDISAIRKRVPGNVEIIHKNNKQDIPNMNVTIAGFTCLEDDIIVPNLEEYVETGDYICFSNVGAYSSCLRADFIREVPSVLVWDEEKGVVVGNEKK